MRGSGWASGPERADGVGSLGAQDFVLAVEEASHGGVSLGFLAEGVAFVAVAVRSELFGCELGLQAGKSLLVSVRRYRVETVEVLLKFGDEVGEAVGDGDAETGFSSPPRDVDRAVGLADRAFVVDGAVG